MAVSHGILASCRWRCRSPLEMDWVAHGRRLDWMCIAELITLVSLCGDMGNSRVWLAHLPKLANNSRYLNCSLWISVTPSDCKTTPEEYPKCGRPTPSLSQSLGLLWSRCRTLGLASTNSMMFALFHFSSPWGSLWMASLPSAVSPSPPSLVTGELGWSKLVWVLMRRSPSPLQHPDMCCAVLMCTFVLLQRCSHVTRLKNRYERNSKKKWGKMSVNLATTSETDTYPDQLYSINHVRGATADQMLWSESLQLRFP